MDKQSGIRINLFISTPIAILIGSVIIALAILVNGGIIKFKGSVATKSPTTQAAQAPTATAPQAPQPEPQAGPVEPLKDEDHVRGERKARILLFEYSDLECPFCKRFHPTAKQIVDTYKGEVAWVYRHFPLDQIHSKADKEAEAIECANELGGEDGFWKMTDKIFEVTPSNNGLNLEDLPKLAGEVGLNQATFKSCLDSGKYTAHVEEDYQGGIKAGITGTPGNILLDTKLNKTKLIPGALPFEQFKQAIDAMLKEA
ncbi:DsbA family protein [Candidatus Daviesbacteria bacterium]|nr:DsbA family protein [Candidatus Daviesbacteria bacterium]